MWLQERTGRELDRYGIHHSFKEFCYRGEQRIGAVAGGEMVRVHFIFKVEDYIDYITYLSSESNK